MNRAVYSIFALLFSLSFTIGAQTDSRRQSASIPNEVAENEPREPDECSTPGRPKPDAAVGLKGSPALCGKAISLPKPAYPAEAKARKISGVVRVEIVIDENGRVIWAEAVKGPQLLREASVKAACQSKHSPIKIKDRAVKAGSVITYNFASE